jgi:hypothetical protein
VGEWTEEMQPLIVEIQPEETWDWEKLDIATSEVQWVNFCLGGDTAGMLWRPSPDTEAIDIEEKVQIPNLLYLPTPIALYAIKGNPKTAIGIYNYAKTYINEPNSGVMVLEAELVLKWLLVGGP